MDLEYLVQIDPIYRRLCRYLRTEDRLRLREVSRDLRELVSANPNTWAHLNLTGRSKDVIMWTLDNDIVSGALQSLILDCTDASEMTITIILMKCPNLRYLGIGSCTELFEGVLNAVKNIKVNGKAPRLQQLGLLGAPHFKTSGVNGIAASVHRDFERLGVTTDLVPCPQQHAFTSKPDEQWHLSVERPSECAACHSLVKGCYPCMNSRTCRGCFRFWCFDCESPITRVCYECGHSCASCKQGIYVKCVDCGSMFCKLHREDNVAETPTPMATSGRKQSSDLQYISAKEKSCDWCIQGRFQGFDT